MNGRSYGSITAFGKVVTAVTTFADCKLACFSTDSEHWFQSNTIAAVSDIAQIPDGQKRQVKIIDTPSQSVRSSIQSVPEPIRVSVASLRNSRAKGTTMQLPSILRGESLTRLLQGAAAGAVATMIIGFN